VREAVRILDKRRVDFEYDGEMAADVALNRLMASLSVLPPVRARPTC
jgi:malate dehydrogenase (oxaloacetate-decarboxylating)(NADP+)